MPPLFIPIVLILILISARAFRDGQAMGVTVVLLANWLVNTAISMACLGYDNDPFPWAAFMAIDYLSAFVILALFHRSVWGIVVAVAFAAECVAHAAYGWSMQDNVAQTEYWYLLHYLGRSQVIVLGIGVGIDQIRRRFGLSRGRIQDRDKGARASNGVNAKP